MKNIEFEKVLLNSAKLPMVKIDRELFLRKELKDKYSSEIIEKAIQFNPAYAGISSDNITKIAKSCIDAETARVTLISAAAGIPGGTAMIATTSGDIIQCFAHVLRIIQKLIYLYGWKDLYLYNTEINQETENLFTLFLGIMYGVNIASSTISKIANKVAQQVVKKLPQQALTKGTIYPIVKKVAQMLGVQMTKQVFSKGVSKVIPIIGAIISGGITFATYREMSEKLRVYLASSELANVEYYKNIPDKENVNSKIIEDTKLITE